jgi:phosphate starvation-inducible membrane PsiE
MLKYSQIILSNTAYIQKKLPYNFLTPWLGKGLLTSSGKEVSFCRTIIPNVQMKQTAVVQFFISYELVGLVIESFEESFMNARLMIVN